MNISNSLSNNDLQQLLEAVVKFEDEEDDLNNKKLKNQTEISDVFKNDENKSFEQGNLSKTRPNDSLQKISIPMIIKILFLFGLNVILFDIFTQTNNITNQKRKKYFTNKSIKIFFFIIESQIFLVSFISFFILLNLFINLYIETHDLNLKVSTLNANDREFERDYNLFVILVCLSSFELLFFDDLIYKTCVSDDKKMSRKLFTVFLLIFHIVLGIGLVLIKSFILCPFFDELKKKRGEIEEMQQGESRVN